MAVLGALTAAIPRRWKPAWLGWWVPVGIVAAVLSDDFTDVGHTIALALGMLVSTRLPGPARWTPSPVRALLAVSAVFELFPRWRYGGVDKCGLIGGAVGALGAVAAM